MNEDWTDFLGALLHAGARFMVVGAHAMAVHGVPRGTQDIDVWIATDHDNTDRVWRALAQFGAPLADLEISLEDLRRPGTVVQLGVPPNRIDILTTISGVPEFDMAWSDRIEHPVRGVPIPFLGRAALIQNKRAAGRHKDMGDLEALGELPQT